MLAYIQTYYIHMQYGPSYGRTNLLILGGMLLILREYSDRKRGALRFALELMGLLAASLLCSSVYYMLFGGAHLDSIVHVVLSIVLLMLIRDHELSVQILRLFVFFSCYYQVIAVSEPMGEWLKALFGDDKTWLENSTWMVVMILILLAVYLINHWEITSMTDVPRQPMVLIILFAGIGIVLQISARSLGISRQYRLIVGISFYVVQLLSYCLFYLLSRETKKNVEMLAIAHKEQLDKELLQAAQENSENLHMIRHEIKNHMAYIRVLLANGDYDRLFAYTNQVLGENEQYIQSVFSGNPMIDAVVNHARQQAERQGIDFRVQVVAPSQLPFEETDFCSILSNLVNNALEGAQASKLAAQERRYPAGEADTMSGNESEAGQPEASGLGAEDSDASGTGNESRPAIELQILPKQDYLFIHVVNPVDGRYSKSRLLSLRTTKADARVHGYGTKVVAKLVEKYEGSVNYQITDGKFIADVMLEMNLQPGDQIQDS